MAIQRLVYQAALFLLRVWLGVMCSVTAFPTFPYSVAFHVFSATRNKKKNINIEIIILVIIYNCYFVLFSSDVEC